MTTATALQQPTRHHAWYVVVILGSLTSFAPLSIDMYLPAFPKMAADLHSTNSIIQLTLTACVIGLGAGQVLVGPLGDALGRKRPLQVGLALYSLFSLACALAPNAELLVGFRLVQAIGGAAGIVTAQAIVRDLYSGAAAVKFQSKLAMVNGLSPIIAPLLGALILHFANWRVVFVVLTAIGLLLFTLVSLLLPETLSDDRRNPHGFGNAFAQYPKLLADRRLVGYMLVAGFGFSTLFAYISSSSFVLQDIYHLSSTTYSLVFAVNAIGIIAIGQLNGRLANRFTPQQLLLAALSIALFGGLLLLVGTQVGLPLVLGALFITASTISMILPNTMSLALVNYPHAAGAAAALMGLSQFVIGGITSPLTSLGGGHSAVPMAATIAAMPFIALLAYLGLARERAAQAR
jgi:DHA1 family bicyclomycin/chloramphenicol resistance-like MFS transporter